MRVLLIKMSSMGDVFHTFPALTDAMKSLPDLKVDWIVEKSFAEIPAWHPVVENVFSIELREWRKTFWKKTTRNAMASFFAEIEAKAAEAPYDLILDGQGLLKSVWVGRKLSNLLDVPLVGMDRKSVREPLSAWFYKASYRVPKELHAITRLRQLFAQALNYEVNLESRLDYQIQSKNHQAWCFLAPFSTQSYVVFLHGTTWDTKYWPQDHWVQLGQCLLERGINLVLPWGTQAERLRSEEIAKRLKNVDGGGTVFIPEEKPSLNQMVQLFEQSELIVSVDTGLSHVAAALDVPLLVLYRVTDPALVGAKGDEVEYLISPLSEGYIKRFQSTTQEQESLVNLKVEDVIASSQIQSLFKED